MLEANAWAIESNDLRFIESVDPLEEAALILVLINSLPFTTTQKDLPVSTSNEW